MPTSKYVCNLYLDIYSSLEMMSYIQPSMHQRFVASVLCLSLSNTALLKQTCKMASNGLKTRMTETKTWTIFYACDWYSQDLRLSCHHRELGGKHTLKGWCCHCIRKEQGHDPQECSNRTVRRQALRTATPTASLEGINSMAFPDTVYLGAVLQHISRLATIKSRLKFYSD